MTDAAYLRTLRDIECGHITLSVAFDRYDTETGLPLPEPAIRTVVPDRAPAIGTPDAAGHWWEAMVECGHLALTDVDRYGRVFYRVTDEGRRFVAAAGGRGPHCGDTVTPNQRRTLDLAHDNGGELPVPVANHKRRRTADSLVRRGMLRRSHAASWGATYELTDDGRAEVAKLTEETCPQ